MNFIKNFFRYYLNDDYRLYIELRKFAEENERPKRTNVQIAHLFNTRFELKRRLLPSDIEALIPICVKHKWEDAEIAIQTNFAWMRNGEK